MHRGIDDDPGDADALAVGHYVDVPPQAAEAALDCVLSGHDPAAGREIPESERLLNAFTQRGVLAGRLAEIFFVPDPRNRDRIVAVAGMGEPGRFGVPELVVLAQLCWSVARLGKRHLTTVLIGAGDSATCLWRMPSRAGYGGSDTR